MKKYFILFFISGLITLSVYGISLSKHHLTPIGNKLDEFEGVAVYNNGPIFYQSHGKNYHSSGYYFGQKWQCVEFVKRYYFIKQKHSVPDPWGHAIDYFDKNTPHGQLNHRRGLIQYNNGGTEKPKIGDLIVFKISKFGHVAIISNVEKKSIEVIQQNILGRTRQKYSLTQRGKNYWIGDPNITLGWLRLKK